MRGVTRPPGVPALSPAAAGAIAAVAGFVGWAAFAFGGRLREAWDVGAWWVVALPALALVAGILGYLVPQKVWRWSVAILGGQLLAMVLLRPAGTDLGLFPLTVVFLLVPLGLIFMVLALIGRAIARRRA